MTATPQLKYLEIEQEIRKLIQTLPIGSKIPPERRLATTFNCNSLTVRKSLQSLVKDGSIVRRVGSGTFVARHSNASPYSPDKNKVGLLVFTSKSAFAQQFQLHLSQVAVEENVNLVSCNIHDFGKEALDQTTFLQKEKCASIIIPWFPLHLSADLQHFVPACPLPVSLPMFIPGLERNYFGNASSFGKNLIRTVEALCHYQMLLGKTRIAFIGPDTLENPILEKMLISYTHFVSSNRLENLACLLPAGNTGFDQLADTWKAYSGDLGIVSYDDEHALRMMTALHKIGKVAPTDYTIIGHNNTEASHYSDPPLSTLQHNFQHACHALIKNAVSMADGESFHAENEAPLTLHVRDTCGGKGNLTPEIREKIKPIIRLD
ncbi:MAG: substrate-binding domain-containing protein [Kiritimatiellae bacterium]|jgi:DNA-binding LacI/PurR family transcriptional regulator|nr:substrate-binding domain-containing protein [Kiritimatiellia bacterium]